jgi:membrane protease YdiL (CAAX protease family)
MTPRMIDFEPGIYPAPWGYLATLGWPVLAAVPSTVIAAIAVLWWRPDVGSQPDELLNDGMLQSILLIVWNVVLIGALALVARLARWPAGKYLGLIRPSGRDAAVALGALAVFLLGFDVLTHLLGRDIVTPFQVTSYLNARGSHSLPLLWFAFVVVGPAGEEILFRGFLYRGWVQSRRDVVPGVVVIAALWAALHIQYDWFGILQIFLMGSLLGLVRCQSGSATLTMLMHGITNFWAMIETFAKVQWLS